MDKQRGTEWSGTSLKPNQLSPEEDEKWMFKKLHFNLTFRTPFEEGWLKTPVPGSVKHETIRPDRPSTAYNPYPSGAIVPFHYKHPITGKCVCDSPWKTLGDLLEHARRNPGKVTWAHSGRGTSVAMNTLLLFKKAGVQTVDVPYKGGMGEYFTALLGGHVDAAPISWSIARDHVKAGKVRYLVFYSDARYASISDVPCAAELGFPDTAKLATLTGMYVHGDTPEGDQKLSEGFYNSWSRNKV